MLSKHVFYKVAKTDAITGLHNTRTYALSIKCSHDN